MIFLPSDSWEIKTTSKKGRGIFATKKILPGTIIGDYLGLVLNPVKDDISEKDHGLYLLYYHDRALIYPADISAPGPHLINHSCMPNSWLYIYQGHTLFFTLRQIYPGEEISISYLLSPNTYCSPCSHQCYCSTLFCTGSMHLSEKKFKKWSAFASVQSAQTKRVPIRYGRVLPLLKEYPFNISDKSVYSLYGSMQEKSIVLSDKKLPSVKKIRTLIRQTGKTILFPNIQLKIFGVEDEAIISQRV